jgi:formylmethanofuran dehydrogenase subunit E
MRALGGIVLALTLAGCAAVQPPACPVGQEKLRTAQLFLGQNIAGKPGVSDADFRKFVDSELTSRFPDGLTILDGGGQWRGSDNQLIRGASKVVVIVLPAKGDGGARIEAARAAYKHRFRQDSVLLLTQASCVSF